MPVIYHSAPRYGFRSAPLTLQLLVMDEVHTLLRVFVEYKVQGQVRVLRLFPTDGFRSEECFSLYTVTVPVHDLCGGRFSYRFSVEGEHTRAYALSLRDAAPKCPDEPVPALLPLALRTRHYLSAGDLTLRFVSFPHEAQGVCVFIKEPNGWTCHTAALNVMGEWECTLPIELLENVGNKLSYYAQVLGESYAARLGEQTAPFTVQLVDDAGPRILEISPSDGEIVPQDLLQIRVSYADASAVDLQASFVYLDGKNVGEAAAWTANGMSFSPKVPLGGGEHVLELDLRDTRGNRTYRRVAFVVEGAKSGKKAEEKKKLSTVQAAGFMAGAFAALKKLLDD